MKIVVIEDEKLSAEHLISLVHRLDKDIEVVGIFDSVKKSVQAFTKGIEADLILLDIHLADGLSFEIFSMVDIDIPIIFTTAYNQYAIDAFKLNSIDYLLKPIAQEDLQRALIKFKKFSKVKHEKWQEMMSTMQKQLANPYKTRFLVKSGQQIDSIKIDDIQHFITLEGVTCLVVASGKKFPVDYSMDQLAEVLPPHDFFRINRKVYIHIKSIQKVNTYFNSRLVLQTALLDPDSSIVSRERVNDFKAWLDQ